MVEHSIWKKKNLIRIALQTEWRFNFISCYWIVVQAKCYTNWNVRQLSHFPLRLVFSSCLNSTSSLEIVNKSNNNSQYSTLCQMCTINTLVYAALVSTSLTERSQCDDFRGGRENLNEGEKREVVCTHFAECEQMNKSKTHINRRRIKNNLSSAV